MTIVAVFLITIMCIYSVTNTAYGTHINSIFEVEERL